MVACTPLLPGITLIRPVVIAVLAIPAAPSHRQFSWFVSATAYIGLTRGESRNLPFSVRWLKEFQQWSVLKPVDVLNPLETGSR
jgi:hypothetical protein